MSRTEVPNGSDHAKGGRKRLRQLQREIVAIDDNLRGELVIDLAQDLGAGVVDGLDLAFGLYPLGDVGIFAGGDHLGDRVRHPRLTLKNGAQQRIAHVLGRDLAVARLDRRLLGVGQLVVIFPGDLAVGALDADLVGENALADREGIAHRAVVALLDEAVFKRRHLGRKRRHELGDLRAVEVQQPAVDVERAVGAWCVGDIGRIERLDVVGPHEDESAGVLGLGHSGRSRDAEPQAEG